MRAALVQPTLLNLAEGAPWFLHMAAEPVKQLWKLHPDLNISTRDTDLVQRRTLCPRDDTSSQNDTLTNTTVANANANANSDTSTNSSPSIVLIAGVLGGMLGLLVLVALAGLFPCLCLRRHRLRLQEKHRQQRLNRALAPLSAFGPHSRRTSAVVLCSPGTNAMNPGGYGVGIGNGGGGRMNHVEGHNYYVPEVSPPITAATSGRNSPYIHGAGWGSDGSSSMNPQARGDYYYTHPVGVTGPQVATVFNAGPSSIIERAPLLATESRI